MFTLISFPGGDDTYDRVILPETMTYDENPKCKTHAKQDEAIFQFGMIWIIIAYGIFVKKDCLCFLEGNFMLMLVFPVFLFIPFKSHIIHDYNVCMER